MAKVRLGEWGFPAIALVAGLGWSSGALAQSEHDIRTGGILIAMVWAAIVYIVPSVVAFSRRHPNRWPILAINIVFGGTGIGWLGSLIWAMGAVHKSPDGGSDGGESGLNIFVNDPKTVRIENPEQLSAAITADPGEQLIRLKKLFDAGALDHDEYTELRRPLLKAITGAG